MAEVTVISQPDNFSASYGKLRYELKVPGGTVESSSVSSGNISSVSGRGRNNNALFSTDLNIDSSAIGSFLTILNTDYYNGVYEISGVRNVSSGSRLSLIDTGTGLTLKHTFNDTGNYEYGSRNLRVVTQLWVNNSFFIEKTRYINNDNLFVFDFAKEMQVWQGNELDPLGFTESGLVSNSELFDSIKIKTVVVTDELVNGVLTEVPQLKPASGKGRGYTPARLYNSGVPVTIINSTVPQVEWVMGSTRGEIKSTGDMSGFIMGDNDSTKRFLTPAPINQIIANNEALEIGFIIDNEDQTNNYEAVIVAYDTTGGTLATNSIKFGTVSNISSGVWRLNVGPRSLSATVIPSNTATYTVHIRDIDTLVAQSETRTFTIDDDCTRTKTRFCWLNERGEYDSFTFKSPRKLKSRVKKDTHKKDRDYSKGIASRQEVTTNVFADDNMTTGTNKVVREVAEWLQGMLESPEVWIELEEGNALHDTRIPVTLNSKSRSITDTYNGMFNINVRYKFGWTKDIIRAK